MSSGAAVNVPTNYKLKEADVNAKLQLYGIYSAFANGKVPSNKQIDVALNSALATKSLAAPSKKLSPEGQKLVADFREVVEQAKILLLTKNEGNLLQDFIWQTQQLSGGDAKLPSAPLDKDTAKQHGNQALDGLRTLGTLLISNGQFRKLLSDASILIRDIAGDAAQKAATRVNPSDEQLSQIDAPAADNTWHDVPDLSKDNLRSQWNDKKPFSKKDAQDAAGDATQSAHPTGSRDPADAAELAARERQEGRDTGVDAQAGARAGISNLKNTASQNIPDEHKDKAREYKERSADYLKNKLPQERRDQAIWRLKKMIVEVQGHQDYQQAIETLLRLAEEYSGHTKNLAGQSTGTVKGAHTDNSLQLAETDLKTLIERFANSTSLDDLFDSINTIYRDADRDPELKGWFKKIDAYIRKCLQQQGFVLQDQANDEWNALYDQGNFLLRERYRNHTDRIADEFKFYADQFDKDPQNTAFGNSLQKLFTDLGNDENGQPTFKPHLIKDLTEVIIPGVFESIRYVPIPRIEYSDPMIDAVVENLVLEGDNLAPNAMEFGSDNYWKWGRKQFTSSNKNKVMLSVSGVQCDLRDVSYYVNKKQGFPSVTDKGVMDIILGGSGLSFKVAMETADKSDRQHFFKVNTVNVDLKHMNIILKKSNHKLLFKIFKPLLLKVMTPVITKVIETQIRQNIHQLDGMLYEVHREAKQAEASAKSNPDPENIQNIYQRYATAANQRMMQGKQKKEEVASDKQVNVAVTQHDSLFPNIKLPGGISTKATEYKELAAKGDKWESPIFGIGSAKETSTLPKLPAVSRKQHSVNTDGPIGGNHPTGGKSSGFGNDGTSGGYGSGASTGQGYGSTGQSGSTGQGYGNSASSGQGYSNSASTGQGYGNSASTGQGYGNSASTGQGYGNSASTGQGYGNSASTGQGYENTGTQGFTNQVEQAFQGSESGGAGAANGNTLLGKNNPVFNGQV